MRGPGPLAGLVDAVVFADAPWPGRLEMLTLVDERERKAEGSGQTLCVVKGEKNILKYMTIVPAHLMEQAVVPAPGSSALAGDLGRTDRR